MFVVYGGNLPLGTCIILSARLLVGVLVYKLVWVTKSGPKKHFSVTHIYVIYCAFILNENEFYCTFCFFNIHMVWYTCI